MKTPILTALALGALALSAAAQFDGPYEVPNWTLENTGANDDGTVDVDGAPATVILTGGDNGSGDEGATLFTVTCVGSGLMTFDWSTVHPDPGFDLVGFVVGDEFFELTDDEDEGSESVLVCAGQVIGFFVETPDNDSGAPELTITNFTAPVGDPWTDLGGGIPGSSGQMVLAPCGSLVGNEPLRVELTGGVPFSSVFWVVSLAPLGVPFKGGVLHPDPAFEGIVPLPLNDEGRITFGGDWLPGIPPGFSFYQQFWAVDPGAVQGFSASNGWQGTTP